MPRKTSATTSTTTKHSRMRKTSRPVACINMDGFEQYREFLLAAGFNPDNPRDWSTCEWLVHCWTSDN